MGLALVSQPAWAQADPQEGEPQRQVQPDDGRLVIDILAPPPEQEMDPVSVQECEDEADAARITGEIVVCRSLGEESDGSWDQEDFERRYAEGTQGPKQPNVDGSGVKLPTEGSVATITVTMRYGDPPPPPLIIDIEALPEAAPGSDADRVGRGFAPLEAE